MEKDYDYMCIYTKNNLKFTYEDVTLEKVLKYRDFILDYSLDKLSGDIIIKNTKTDEIIDSLNIETFKMLSDPEFKPVSGV